MELKNLNTRFFRVFFIRLELKVSTPFVHFKIQKYSKLYLKCTPHIDGKVKLKEWGHL